MGRFEGCSTTLAELDSGAAAHLKTTPWLSWTAVLPECLSGGRVDVAGFWVQGLGSRA